MPWQCSIILCKLSAALSDQQALLQAFPFQWVQEDTVIQHRSKHFKLFHLSQALSIQIQKKQNNWWNNVSWAGAVVWHCVLSLTPSSWHLLRCQQQWPPWNRFSRIWPKGTSWAPDPPGLLSNSRNIAAETRFFWSQINLEPDCQVQHDLTPWIGKAHKVKYLKLSLQMK